jgi:hypothetical protein
MPVYFIHGFRWPRALIRIHIILHNLEDSAAEWLVAPGTTREMLDNFNRLYPDSMEHLQQLRFVEQYDPDDTTAGSGSQPYAYVADVVEEVKLGVDVDEIRGKGVPNDQWASIMELRDQLAPDEKVAWYIVVCGDEERWAPSATGERAQQEEPAHAIPYREREPERETAPANIVDVGLSVTDVTSLRSKPLTRLQAQHSRADQPPQEEQPKGIKKLFHSVSRRKR